jgi:reverse gyrase
MTRYGWQWHPVSLLAERRHPLYAYLRRCSECDGLWSSAQVVCPNGHRDSFEHLSYIRVEKFKELEHELGNLKAGVEKPNVWPDA